MSKKFCANCGGAGIVDALAVDTITGEELPAATPCPICYGFGWNKEARDRAQRAMNRRLVRDSLTTGPDGRLYTVPEA